MKQLLPSLTALLFLLACNAPSEKNNVPEFTKKDTANVVAATPENKPEYTPAMVDNKNDFSCGMPVTAGIEDTCHYNGKVYGFCSKECKKDFLSKPEEYLSGK